MIQTTFGQLQEGDLFEYNGRPFRKMFPFLQIFNQGKENEEIGNLCNAIGAVHWSLGFHYDDDTEVRTPYNMIDDADLFCLLQHDKRFREFFGTKRVVHKPKRQQPRKYKGKTITKSRGK